MNKILIVFVFISIMVSSTFMLLSQVDNQDSLEQKTESNNLYHGPINLGYNETHFRLYGEHILEDVR